MSSADNVGAVSALDPSPVWEIFAGIAAVPRPSKAEQLIREHVRAFAGKHSLPVREDEAGNLLVDVPATAGREQAPTTVLQGHLDMVCEKNAGTAHDFDHDPIRLVVATDPADGQQIVRADGTTLGADNGIGVALALAAATCPDVIHGPLELLMTMDEEAGMTGAKALEPKFFRGRRMLNLDSEEDDAIYIGCAGGYDTTLTWSLASASPASSAEMCQVSVTGLKGGHSGCDIHLNRSNAIKLIAWTLGAAPGGELQLIDMNGGSLRNAIPREATATVAGPTGTRAALASAASAIQAEVVAGGVEAGCSISVNTIKGSPQLAALSIADTQRLLSCLAGLPHGVLAVVPEIAGLVQTSNSVSTVCTRVGANGAGMHIEIGCLSRSSNEAAMQEALRQISAVGCLADARVEHGNDYPGWQPNVDSPTLATCRRVYEQLFDESPHVTAIHAGLECGIIGQRVGGNMDMVSIGPRIEGAHSPDERVYVASVGKTWKYLKAILAALANGE